MSQPYKLISKDNIGKKLDKTFLDFSSKEKYNLVNVEYFEENEFKKEYKDLMLLNLDNNSISKLVVKGFNKLDTISSCRNLITSVDLNLNRLTKLYLNNNLLWEIPELDFIPNLRELSLAENSITALKVILFKPVKGTLEKLDLSQNKIDFNSCSEFIETAKNFGKNMKKLSSFNIIGNPFCEKRPYKDYSIILISHFDNLDLFNNKDTLGVKKSPETLENLEKKMLSLEELTKNQINQTPGQTNYGSNVEGDFSLFGNSKNEIELNDIVKKTAKLTTIGKMTFSTLKELTALVSQYINKKKSNISADKESIEDPELNEFDNFLDLINILLDTSPMFEKNIYYLVCDFINVKNGKFAGRIISYLRQRIFSEKSDDLQNFVMEHLERRIDFRRSPISEISPYVIIGIETLLLNPVMSKRISFLELTNKLIDYIVRLENINLINCRLNEEFRKKETYNSILIYLVTATSIKEHYIFMIKNLKFMEQLSKHIKNILTVNFEILLIDAACVEILLMQLNLLKNLFVLWKTYFKKKVTDSNLIKYEEEENFNPTYNLQKVIGGGLREKIEQILNLRFQELNKKNSSEKEFNINKNRIILALISCYSGLIYNSNDIRNLLRDEKSMPFKIINLLVQSELYDPSFIGIACDFTLLMLENEQLLARRENFDEFKKVVKSLYGLRYVLPYLCYVKPEYKNSCLRVEKYGENAIIRGKPVEFSLLSSQRMQNMIISIVKLIEYFGRNTKNESHLSNECKSFCKELNDQKKDSILCSCLVVPNEKVKIAILESLYSMDCSHFNTDEIGALFRQLYDVSLSGEYIEKIISTIFLILDQSFKNFLSESGLEGLKQNKEIFNLALEILAKNNDRSVTMDFLYKKKVMLNCSISAFLNNCCRSEYVNILFNDKGKSKRLCEILQAEENNLYLTEKDKKFPYYIPIEVEKIRSGYRVENLMSLFTNEKYLTPFTYISSRVLIHLADTLMNIRSSEIVINNKLELDDLFAEVQEKFSEREYKRILIESLTFHKFLEYKKDLDLKLYENLEDRKNEQNNFLNKFEIFMKYIKGETNNKMNLKFSSIWKNKFDPIFDEDIIYEDDQTKKIREEREFNIYKMQYEEEEIIRNKYKIPNFDLKIKEEFIKNLRKEEYFPLLENFQISKHYLKDDLLNYEKYTSKEYTIVRRREEEDPNNPYLRSLFISAFLRCIFALIDSPADMSIKNGIIEKLSDSKNLRDLAKLVETCISCDFNVPSKLINIIKHILLMPKKIKKNIETIKDHNGKNHEDDLDNSSENNTKYIATLIKKITFKVKNNLTLELDDHKILLLNICECISILCNNLNYSHPDMTRITNFSHNINFRKKYILSKKVEEYIDISIIDLFVSKITDYMNEESKYFHENSYKEKGNENNNNNNQEANNEDKIIEINLEDEENLEIEQKRLRNRINNSNEIKILSLLDGKGPNIDKVEKINKFCIDEILIKLISAIPLFLGEYMAKSDDERVYDILEKLTRSNVFNGIIIRKSYLKEILDIMNLAKKRKLISNIYKSNFMTRTHVFDIKKKEDEFLLLFVFDDEMQFVEADESTDDKNDLIVQEKFKNENEEENSLMEQIISKVKFNTDKIIYFNKITAIYTFEIKNLLLIKIDSGASCEIKLFFFKKYYISDLIIEYIKTKNCTVNIFENVEIFISEQEALKINQGEKLKDEIKDEIRKINEIKTSIIEEKNKEDLNNNLIKTNMGKDNIGEENLDKNIQENLKEKLEKEGKLLKLQEERKIEKLAKSPNESVTMYCNIPLKGIFDFFLNIFKSEKEIAENTRLQHKDNRVIKVNGELFEIYDEIKGSFNEINFEIFKKEDTNISEIGKAIKNCFKKYETKEILKWTKADWKLNTLKIGFDSDEYEIHCFDDFSMIKLKSCLYHHRMKQIKIENVENYNKLEVKKF